SPEDFVAAADRFLRSEDVALARTAIELLANRHDEPSVELLRFVTGQLRDGSLDPALAFDVIEAARASSDAIVAAELAAYQERKDATDPLAPFLETMTGGDAARGRDLFTNSVAAQCTLCHSINGGGSGVGPNLRGVGAKPTRHLLESLVNPGA